MFFLLLISSHFVCYHGFFFPHWVCYIAFWDCFICKVCNVILVFGSNEVSYSIAYTVPLQTAFTLKCCLRRQLTRFWKGTFVFIHIGFGGWTQIRSGFCWHAETSVFHCHPVSLFSGKRSGILQKWILTESVVNWISQKTSCVSGFQFYSWPQRGTLGMKLDTSPQRTTTSIR